MTKANAGNAVVPDANLLDLCLPLDKTRHACSLDTLVIIRSL